MTTATRRHEPIPADHPVRPLEPHEHPPGRTTCGDCGLSWDDDIGTSLTPVPSGRCPFEQFHIYEDKPAPPSADELADALRNLLACCELNLDDMEDETRDAIDDARELLDRIDA